MPFKLMNSDRLTSTRLAGIATPPKGASSLLCLTFHASIAAANTTICQRGFKRVDVRTGQVVFVVFVHENEWSQDIVSILSVQYKRLGL